MRMKNVECKSKNEGCDLLKGLPNILHSEILILNFKSLDEGAVIHAL